MIRRAAVAAVLAALAAGVAWASDGALADALRGAFGGNVAVRSQSDNDVLTWDAATRSWGAAAPAGGDFDTAIAQTASATLSVAGANGLQLLDQTSGATIPAGHSGIYSLNSGGIQQVIVATGAGSGGFVGPWVSYTPVVSHSNVTASGYWRWSGPTTIECEVTLTYTGAPSGGLVIDTVPSTLLAAGWSMSTTVGRPSGYGHMRDSSVSYTTYPLEILLEDADSAAPYYRNAVSTVAAVTHTAPITIASGDDARFFFHVHVTR